MSSREYANVRVTRILIGRKTGQPFCKGENESGVKFHFSQRLFNAGELTVGSVVTVQAIPPDPRGAPEFRDECRVIDIKQLPMPGVSWAKWQESGLNGEGLPETQPGQEGVELSFGCVRCGTQLVGPQDIFKIKGGCIWTCGAPATLQPYGDVAWNQFKGVNISQARCVRCRANVGAYYEQAYKDAERGKSFPCYKLAFRRERVNGTVGYHAQHLVLLGDKAQVQTTLTRLKRAGNGLVIAARVSDETYSLAQQLREMEHKLRAKQAERDMARSIRRQWEVEIRPDEWEPLPAAAIASLERGQLARYAAAGQEYLADPEALTQHTVSAAGDSVPQRLRVSDARFRTQGSVGLVEIQRECDEVWGECTRVYNLKHATQAVDMTADHLHFALAATQFTLMTLIAKRPCRIAHVVNPGLQQRYEEQRAEFQREGKPTNEIWGFYGTSDEATRRIFEEGFSVGGEGDTSTSARRGRHRVELNIRAGHAMASHRANHGTGNHIILAKALIGEQGEEEGRDSWMPRNGSIVFKAPSQVLPLYDIYYVTLVDAVVHDMDAREASREATDEREGHEQLDDGNNDWGGDEAGSAGPA
jgi:hypothetical protein